MIQLFLEYLSFERMVPLNPTFSFTLMMEDTVLEIHGKVGKQPGFFVFFNFSRLTRCLS